MADGRAGCRYASQQLSLHSGSDSPPSGVRLREDRRHNPPSNRGSTLR
jgi:hypothetical protein